MSVAVIDDPKTFHVTEKDEILKGENLIAFLPDPGINIVDQPCGVSIEDPKRGYTIKTQQVVLKDGKLGATVKDFFSKLILTKKPSEIYVHSARLVSIWYPEDGDFGSVALIRFACLPENEIKINES